MTYNLQRKVINLNLVYRHLRIYLKTAIFFTWTIYVSTGCVQTKKQLILKDIKLTKLKAQQSIDTVIQTATFQYRLKPGDIISINIASLTKGEYDFAAINSQGNFSSQMAQGGGMNQSGYVINDSGYVLVPILGSIYIQGLTIPEAQSVFQQKINQILAHATVTIKMLNYAIVVLGEVMHQGRLISLNDRVSIIDAIGMAGGFSEFANRSKIKRLRTVKDKTQISYINLEDLRILNSPDFYLLPNDVIIVEPLRAKTTKQYSIPNITLTLSTLSFVLVLFITINNLLGN